MIMPVFHECCIWKHETCYDNLHLFEDETVATWMVFIFNPVFFLQYDRYGNSSSCNLPCTGDSNKICGGPWALSVYNTGKDFIPLHKIKETISMRVVRNVMNGMTCAPLGGISAIIDQRLNFTCVLAHIVQKLALMSLGFSFLYKLLKSVC